MQTFTLLTALLAVATASPLSVNVANINPGDVIDHLINTGKVTPQEKYNTEGKLIGTLTTVDDALFTATRESLAKGKSLNTKLTVLATSGLPTSPSAAVLAKRERETYTCFGSGSWAKLGVLYGAADEVCGMHNFNERNGQWAQVSTTYKFGNSVGHAMAIKSWMRLGGGWFANKFECTKVYNMFLNNNKCHGANSDTRGGHIYRVREANGHYIELGIDPTTQNCDC